MASLSSLGPQELATSIRWARLVTCCNFASVTILILDWLLTFDLEVSLVWKSRWNIMKGLYLLARYLPFVDVTLALLHQFSDTLQASQCQQMYEAQSWIFVSGAALVEIIFSIRTWAVWKQGTRCTLGLIITFFVIWTGVVVANVLYLKGTSHGSSLAPHLIGCFMTKSSPILFVGYILLMLYDAFLLTLMVIRGLSIFRAAGAARAGENNRLALVVFGDGIIYFFYIFGAYIFSTTSNVGSEELTHNPTAISLINILIITRLPVDLEVLLMMPARVIHAVLACRVVLHIREQAEIQQRGGLEEDLVYSQYDS
ncbi:hypothetical protein D9756_000205 [Leucocoprinus leucothites]|uniref:DUF6533 domain-containing protein n=1 Tax=Leucocoprinus leucothites TaxID=201217 RepID=A0A8H5GE87_9AGAR|nr:hypothetical protein D9756_000205 [Leucoagaricus leucothites]